MAKFKFNKDWSGGTYVPPGSQMATRRVDFKQGQVVEGNMIRNEKQSEPPNFIVVNTPQGTVHIGFGGRSGSVLTNCIQPLNCIKAPCGEIDVCSGGTIGAKKGDGKEIQPTTNLPDPRVKRYLMIGFLVLILVGLVFAYKKCPKAVKMLGVVVLIALVIKGSINYNKYGNLIGWH